MLTKKDLSNAIDDDDLETINKCIKNGVNIDTEHLYHAIMMNDDRDDSETTLTLLKHAECIDLGIIIAICNQWNDHNYDIIQYMLSNELFINSIICVTDITSKQQNYETMQLLIDYSMIDINRALNNAIIVNDDEMVQLLLNNGADENILKENDYVIKF